MENRNNEVKSLSFEEIAKDSNARRWKAMDTETGKSIIIDVSSKGDVRFTLCDAPPFPYTEAFNTVAQLEGKKLIFNVSKRSRYNNILKKVENIQKVPCDIVSFQIYYLNP